MAKKKFSLDKEALYNKLMPSNTEKPTEANSETIVTTNKFLAPDREKNHAEANPAPLSPQKNSSDVVLEHDYPTAVQSPVQYNSETVNNATAEIARDVTDTADDNTAVPETQDNTPESAPMPAQSAPVTADNHIDAAPNALAHTDHLSVQNDDNGFEDNGASNSVAEAAQNIRDTAVPETQDNTPESAPMSAQSAPVTADNHIDAAPNALAHTDHLSVQNDDNGFEDNGASNSVAEAAQNIRDTAVPETQDNTPESAPMPAQSAPVTADNHIDAAPNALEHTDHLSVQNDDNGFEDNGASNSVAEAAQNIRDTAVPETQDNTPESAPMSAQSAPVTADNHIDAAPNALEHTDHLSVQNDEMIHETKTANEDDSTAMMDTRQLSENPEEETDIPDNDHLVSEPIQAEETVQVDLKEQMETPAILKRNTEIDINTFSLAMPINLVEKIVWANINTILKNNHICNCFRCQADATSIALNKITTKYISSYSPNQALGDFYYKSHFAEIMSAMLLACSIVKNAPRHDEENAVNDDSLCVHNLTEKLVKTQIRKMLPNYTGCCCDRCLNDIAAIMLNKLPPKYFITTEGKLFAKLVLMEQQYHVDLTTQFFRASLIVQQAPNH